MGGALVPVSEAPVAVASTDELSDLQRLGNLLAASGYFNDAREMAQAAVKVMAGRELGVPTIASMMGINVIKGKIAMGGNLIAARIRAHGYDYRITRHDDTGCDLEFYSKADKDGQRTKLGVVSFTEDDAKKADVFSAMYRKYPKNMYFNRAISNGGKWYTPEVFAGMPVYVPEELGAEVDAQGDVIHPDGKPAPKPRRKTKKTPYSTDETREEIAARRVEELKNGRVAELKTGDEIKNGDTPVQPVSKPSVGTASTDARQPAAGKPGGGGNGAPAANGDVPPEVATLWGKMGDFPSSVEVFADLKKDIDEVQGSTIDYYQILHKFGMRHGNDLKGKDSEGKPRTRGHARLCARELLEHLNKCKAEPPAENSEDPQPGPWGHTDPPATPPCDPSPYQASDADLPVELGGT